MKNGKDREIFRYSDENEDFIGIVHDVRDEIEELIFSKRNKSPFKDLDSPILWISITRTNKTAKKDPRYKQNIDNALCGQSSENKIKQAWDIIGLVSKWIEKESPELLAISAYDDSAYKKRFRIYNRFLTKRNYKLFYVDYDSYETPIAVYAINGLDIKYPNIKLDFNRI